MKMKINIDVKDPITSSILLIIVGALVTSLILIITQPSYIIEISKTGKKEIKISLLISISLLIGLFIGTAKFIFFNQIHVSKPVESNTLIKNNFAFDPNKY